MPSTPDPTPLAPRRPLDKRRYVPFLLCASANKYTRGSSRVFLKMFGLGISEWRIMRLLTDHAGTVANQLCVDLDMDKAAVSRSLGVLNDMGLVSAAGRGGEGRGRALTLTPKGEALRDRISEVAISREQRLLEGFTEEEREQLIGYLGRLLDNVAEMNRADTEVEAPPPPPRRSRAA